MKIIDKLIMIIMGVVIMTQISWQKPIPLIGLLPVIYCFIYLIHRGIKDWYEE